MKSPKTSGDRLPLLLREIVHLGELSRLVRVVAACLPAELGEREITELISMTAGLGPRYPRPRAAIALGARLGLLTRGRRQTIVLSELGRRFLEAIPLSGIDCSVEQGKLLFGLLLEHPECSRELRSVLRSLKPGEDGLMSAEVGP